MLEDPSSDSSKSQRRLVIAVTVFLLVVSGVVCLAVSLPLGALAIRAARAVESQPSPTSVMAASATPAAASPQTQPPSPTLPPPRGTPSPVLPSVQATSRTAPQVMLTATSPGAALPPVLVDAWCVPWNAKSEPAVVTDVIDGVTFEVKLGGEVRRVRYIGIDLLEFQSEPQTWYAMTEKNRQLVEGKQVLLLEGLSQDEGGDLLRYVLVEGVFANYELVRDGYAVARSAPPDTACDGLFEEAQKAAILAQRGLWRPKPTPTRTLRPPTATVSAYGPLVVVKVSQGTEWQEPDEFVEIFNSGSGPVQLEGWSISDSENHIFVFPRFVLGPAQYCRVYTNVYAPTHCGFSFYNPSPIWNDRFDCAYLKDKDGRLIDQFCYE